jgi:hypothetical protein
MDTDALEEHIKQVLKENGLREDDHGYYHPSQVTGCPLKVFLDKMTQNETVLNSWLFQGSAVHYYLQNHPSPDGHEGIITEALHKSGYHAMHTGYEVHTKKDLGDGVTLTGTCDILCQEGDTTTIFDIKYSSLKPEYGHGRVLKYFSQANTYAFMFDADEYGLIFINSKSQKLEDDIYVMDNEPSEDNWDLVKSKARAIHNALENRGYDEGVAWPVPELEQKDVPWWEDLLEMFDRSNIPAYDEECQYCDHSDYCPVKNGKLSSGLDSFRNGS